MWLNLVNVSCELEKNVCSSVNEWNALSMSIIFSWNCCCFSVQPCPYSVPLEQWLHSWSGGCMVLEQLCNTQCPRAKEKPQKDGGGCVCVKLSLESNPIPARDAQRAQTYLVCTKTQRPNRDWDRAISGCLLRRYGWAMDCCRGRDSVCSRPGYGISPLGGGHH